MWLTFLNHWNGVSFFLGGDVLFSPDLQLFTDASGSHGYGGFLNGEWFQATWLPQHLLNPTMYSSIDRQVLFAIKKKKKKNTLFIHGCLIRHIYNN